MGLLQSQWVWKQLGPQGALISVPLLPSPPSFCSSPPLNAATPHISSQTLLLHYFGIFRKRGGRGGHAEERSARKMIREGERAEGERRDNATPGNGRHGNSHGNPGQNTLLIKKLINCLWIAYLCAVFLFLNQGFIPSASLLYLPFLVI